MYFTFWGQKEFEVNYQTFFWYLFLIDEVSEDVTTSLTDFLHSKHFKEEAQSFLVKKSKGDRHIPIGRPFDEENLFIELFKKFNKAEMQTFFLNYSEPNREYEGKTEFIFLMNNFFDWLKKESTNEYYIISKEWFNKDDRVLNDISELYTYYFIIIW